MKYIASRRMILFASAVLTGFLLVGCQTTGNGGQTFADGEPVWLKNGRAIDGYDPVAYFAQGKPAKGRDDLVAKVRGVNWHFASVDNRKSFVADPVRYMPAYGGHCSAAMTSGDEAPGNGEMWSISNGVLHLNSSARAQKYWLRDVSSHTWMANSHWEDIADKRFPYAAGWVGKIRP